MAWIEKRANGRWYVCWYEGRDAQGRPRKRDKSLKTTSRKVALELAAGMEREALEGVPIAPAPILFEEVVKEYLADAALRRPDSSLRRDRDLLNAFCAQSPKLRASDVTPKMIDSYLKGLLARGLSKRTHNLSRSILGACFKWAVEHRHVRSNPVATSKPIPLARPTPAFLSAAELDALLAKARDTFLEIPVALGALAGLRKGEMERLRWDDVDKDARVLRIEGAKNTRGGTKSRVVPIAVRLAEILERHRDRTKGDGAKSEWVMLNADGGRLLHNLRARLMALGKAAGIEQHVHPHLLRHTFASQLAMAGVSLWKIARWLGHSQIQTTMIYAHLAPQHDEDIDAVGGNAPQCG
jgi:integrase/recombinase XerC